MTKLLVIILAAIVLIFGYFNFNQKADQTKTTASPETVIEPDLSEDYSLSTIDAELQATELEDFDQEIEALDESINQL